MVLGAGCTLPPPASPTPTGTPSPISSLVPTPSATRSDIPTPAASNSTAGSVPQFTAGTIVSPSLDGMRVRRLPGTQTQVVAGLVPAGADLAVIMGPIPVEDFSWYLIADVDPAEPTFDEAWIAAGFEPGPFLAHAADRPTESPYVASYGYVGPAEFGPVSIPDADHAIRWLALDPRGVACTFAVSLTTGGGEPIPAIRATVGASIVPGTLQPQYFADQPQIRGQVFVSVDGTCAWTLGIVHVAATPTPTAEG